MQIQSNSVQFFKAELTLHSLLSTLHSVPGPISKNGRVSASYRYTTHALMGLQPQLFKMIWRRQHFRAKLHPLNG